MSSQKNLTLDVDVSLKLLDTVLMNNNTNTDAIKFHLYDLAGLTCDDLEANELAALALAVDSETANGVDVHTAAKCAVDDLLDGNLELA